MTGQLDTFAQPWSASTDAPSLYSKSIGSEGASLRSRCMITTDAPASLDAVRDVAADPRIVAALQAAEASFKSPKSEASYQTPKGSILDESVSQDEARAIPYQQMSNLDEQGHGRRPFVH